MNLSRTIWILLLVFLAACGSNEGSTAIEGRVVDKGEQALLIVKGVSEEEANALDEDAIHDGGVGEAFWIYGIEDPDSFDQGDLVKVTTDEIMESYPAQAEAITIEQIGE
ncbi:DUF3221 domain-containing protein [Alteribacter aurantiacus]|uniref:DUF3221 domain-containing protein n=1 Tax=Alteribacter aurantiacus TaxID=254410 RepID=UPI000479CA39|nr:DUF3221 domain-containing protein [Alteribacter aurantiacus]